MKTKMKALASAAGLCAAALAAYHAAAADDIVKYDSNMATQAVVADGLKWIDGRTLPIEGRAFDDTEHWYDRLPSNVTKKVNGGVRNMKHHTAGMQFRFTTDSKRLVFKWKPYNKNLAMGHMPATGVSGIDVYRYDAKAGKWLFVKRKGGVGNTEVEWTPGTPCLVYLPLYNGVRDFMLGVEPNATVSPLGPRKSGIEKPVVFYGTSITHGACASRPGMAFVNIVGRDLDVPVVNLGFSGSGLMELEMSEHLAKIDASCYVLDCLWNMELRSKKRDRNVDVNYEPFIRSLRAKRPGVPIVMAGRGSVFGGAPDPREEWVRKLYEKLVAEGWKDLVFLPGAGMYADDLDGTVDGVHPNDWGMKHWAKAYGGAVKKALNIK